MSEYIPYKSKRPPNDPPELDQVWENMNTGRKVRVTQFITFKGKPYVMLETLDHTRPSKCSFETLANSYTWRLIEAKTQTKGE